MDLNISQKKKENNLLIIYKLNYLLKYSWNYCFFTIICRYQR